MTPLALGINGGAGRLGRLIVAAALRDPAFALTAVVVREGSAFVGKDACCLTKSDKKTGLLIESDPHVLMNCALVIDVSTPISALDLARNLARQNGPPLVTGVTGWTSDQEAALARTAHDIALLKTDNFSLGVTALARACTDMAARLGPDWGVHIHDLHHAAKKDAPSGTALLLARAIEVGWGCAAKIKTFMTADGAAPPPGGGEIIITSTREGAHVGQHDVCFTGPDETVRLGHDAQDRRIFARGALRAARWLHGRAPGLYDMNDVLG